MSNKVIITADISCDLNKPLEETLDLNGFTIIGVSDFLLRFIK